MLSGFQSSRTVSSMNPPPPRAPRKRTVAPHADGPELKRQMIFEDCATLRSDGMLTTADCLAEFATEAVCETSTLQMVQVLAEGLKEDIAHMRSLFESEQMRMRRLSKHIQALTQTNRALKLQLRLVECNTAQQTAHSF